MMIKLKTVEHQRNDHEFDKVRAKMSLKCKQSGIKYIYGDLCRRQGSPDDLAHNFINSSESKFVQIHIRDLISTEILEICNSYLQRIDKKLLICTDCLIGNQHLSNIKIMFHPYLLGINHWHVDTDCYSHLQTNTPSKLYNCFINRIEPVRQSWFYFLHIHGLLNQGHVSYLAASIPPELRQGLEFFDHVHNSSDLPKLEKFQTAYEQLRSSIPYRNFKENSMLIDKILDSKYSLVLDTYAVSDDCNSWFISEKAARCLMLPTCHLMFLQKNTLQKLSELGIMIGQSNLTFDQESWQDRQQKSLQILISNQDEYNFIDLKKRALHNHHVFRTMFESNHSGFYDNVIDVAMAW